jgi:hypothetical protein
MKLLFTKRAGKTDDLLLTRDDGSTEHVICPKQGIIPHDMVHFAVEKIIRERGFLSKVESGEAARGRMVPEQAAEAIERLVEAMQAASWSGGGAASDIIGLYDMGCQARGHAALPVSVEQIELIEAEIARLTRAWDAVAVNGSLALSFEAA